MGKTTKRWLSWVLAAAMVVAGAGFPVAERTAQAAEKTITNGTNSSNAVYVEFALDTKNTTSSYNQYSVNLHNNTAGAICDWKITVKFAGDPGWNAGWNGAGYDSSTKTLTIQTYGESGWSNAIIYAGDTGSGAGFQVKAGALDSATVTITYKEGDSSSGAATGTGSSTGSGGSSTGGDVTIESTWDVEDDSVLMSYVAEDLYDSYTEYKFAVENLGKSTVSGNLVITFDKSRQKNWWTGDFNIGLNNNELTISNLSIAAGGSAGPIQIQLKPLGASITCVTFAGKKIAIGKSKGSTEAGELKYELTGKGKTVAFSDTPVGKHGRLSLKKVDGYGNAPVIVDKNGKPFQLRGASTHGMHWFEGYVNEAAFQSLRDEWGVNMVRLVVYPNDNLGGGSGGGYLNGYQSKLDQLIDKGVAAAEKLGMYVLIDWHVHNYNPHQTQSGAETFFRKYVAKYGDLDNVLFEICNEPTNTPWYNGGSSDLYSYCRDIVKIIREECGNDSLVICGTNTYSQDVEDVAGHSMADLGYKNIMYTFHFYSATHRDSYMNKVKTAVAAGTPIFVTEYGICDASGGSPYDIGYADKWITMLDGYNISYACWSMCNKGEAASYFKSSCSKTSGWTEEDLTATGIWLVNTYRDREETEQGGETTQTVESIILDKTTLALTTNGSSTSATIKPGITTSDGEAYTGTVAWTSSSTGVASVANGVVTAKGNGTATITAKAGGKTATCTVTVTTVLKGISLSDTKVSMNKGATKKLTVTYNPATASNKKITWSSSAESIASVSDGTITARSNGTAVITAKSEEGNYTAACTVTVTTAVTGVTLNKTALTLEVGAVETLTANVKPDDADNKNVTWKSDNAQVASVSTTGKVTAVKKGTANITVTTQDGSKTASCKVTVNKKTRTSPQDAKCNLGSRTSDSLTINVSGSLDKTAQTEYQLGNGAWTTNTTFTGLEECREYTVKVRYKETEEYEASSVFATAAFYTLSATPYTIDVSKVSDSGYIDALCETVNKTEVKTVIYDGENKILTLTQPGKTYTLTGTNPDLTIVAADGVNHVVLQDTQFSSLDIRNTAGTSVTVTSRGENSIVSTKDNTPGIQMQNRTEMTIAGNGNLTVTGGGGAAGIGSQGTVKITDGTVTVNGGSQASAVLAEQAELLGGTVNVNVGAGADGSVSAVTVDEQGNIVIDNAQVSSNTTNIYSKDPVDKNGNSIVMQRITYKDEKGTVLGTLNARKGSNITLFDIIGQRGYKKVWRCEGTDYQANAVVYNVSRDMTFVVVATPIKVTAITVKNGNTAVTASDVITLDKRLNETAILKAAVTPEDALDTSLTWTSGNTDVVTVANGRLTPVGVGETTITVTANDGSGIKATISVRVIESEAPKQGDKKEESPGKDVEKTGGDEGGKQGEQVTGDKGDEGGGPDAEEEENAPGKAAIKKVTAGKKKLTVKWKKVKDADGYQVCVSQKKNFAGAKVIKVNSGKKTKAVVKKLKSKKKYYVRVRAVSKSGGKTVYGAWSKAKNKKVK